MLNHIKVLQSNVVEPKTKYCTLMCFNQWPNDTVSCGTPYSHLKLTDRRIRFLFIKYGPKLVELVDPKNKTGFWFLTVWVMNSGMLTNFIGVSQASAERRDLVPERCRSWSFQVVPWTRNDSFQLKNVRERGTTRTRNERLPRERKRPERERLKLNLAQARLGTRHEIFV